MLAERYLRKRYEAGWKEGYKIGWEKGYEEGREQARRLDKERWRRYKARFLAWNERRLMYQADGKPFDEPMPIFGDEGVVLRDVLTDAERRADDLSGAKLRVARMICRSFRR